MVKFVQTRFRYIEDARTHILIVELHLEFPRFYRKFSKKTLLLWKFDFAIIASMYTYLPSQRSRQHTAKIVKGRLKKCINCEEKNLNLKN